MQNFKTKKLYDTDAYAREFEATVISCEEAEWVNSCGDKSVLYAVILNQTLFFPEEGGQTPDKGKLNQAEVVDVQIEKDVITHIVTEKLEIGAVVKGEIDWQHRFDNMQQHSAEHIFSGLVYQKYGLKNVGFHLSNQIVTMDFDKPLSKEILNELEWNVNEAIAENVEIKTGYPSEEELASLEYRSKIEIEGDIRIVEIVGYDICACCAPHVHRTGEIGCFKIQNVQNYKGGMRISFVCGFRALQEYRKKSEIISELSGLLTTNSDNLTEHVGKLKTQVQSLKTELSAVKQALLETQIEHLPAEQKNVILFEKEIDSIAMRNVVNKLTKSHEGICAVFSGDEERGYHYIIGSSSLDCREIAEHLKANLGARGGGKAPMVQGSVQAKQKMIMECLRE